MDNSSDVIDILEGGGSGIEGNINYYDRLFAPLIMGYLNMKKKEIPYDPDKGDVFTSFYIKLVKSLKNKLKKQK